MLIILVILFENIENSFVLILLSLSHNNDKYEKKIVLRDINPFRLLSALPYSRYMMTTTW